MVTLKHIAEKAGVTVSVVSRALNPRPDRHARVAPETKARIEETALALGFRRNRNAEFLKRGKSPVIQVFLPSRACSLMADLIYGMAESAEKADFPLSFTYGSTEESFSRFLLGSSRNRTCGVLAHLPRLGDDYWNRMDPELKTVKMIGLNTRQTVPSVFPTLSIGYQEAGELAAAHLIGKGCSRLAVLGKPSLRTIGFLSAAAQSAVPAEVLAPVDAEGFLAWIRQAPPPVGVFAVTDILALKTSLLLQKAGIRIPEDVRLIGHDDREFAVHLTPSLSTIRQQYREQGREAIHMIISMMYDDAISSKVIPPVLIARKSS